MLNLQVVHGHGPGCMIFQNFIDMQQFIDTYDFSGKKAIVRVDFNVPLNDKMEITDDTRIRAAIPTLKKVLEKGGSLIIMSHLDVLRA